MGKPLVSVIIPCFNGRRWLGEAIESAFAQTWDRIEVIVVDDGSTDDSLRVASSYGERVRLLDGPNGGPGAARNRGLDAAQGEWIQFLDADDVLLPRKIEACMESASSDINCLPLSLTENVADSGRPLVRSSMTRRVRRSAPRAPRRYAVQRPVEMVLASRVQTHQWLHRREVLAKLGGYRAELRWEEDVDLNLRLALTGMRFRLVPEILVLCRHHHSPGRQRLDPASVPGCLRAELGMLEELRMNGVLQPPISRIMANRLAWAARRAWRQGLRREAREAFRVALSLDPAPNPSGVWLYNLVSHILGLEETERLVDWVLGALPFGGREQR